MSAHHEQATASRRSILGGAAGAGALGLVGAGAAGIATAGPASAHGTITTYAAINGARTVYEVNGALTAWGYRPSFHDRLNSWLAFWNANTPSSYADASRVWGYGAHTDHRVTEAHNNGRGFDLSRIYTGSTRRFTARYDIWRTWSGSDLTTARRHYWATSASAHHHFRNVLTYLYNAGHHNHIHIDNLVSGTGLSTFSTASSAQVQHVQACCRYLWGLGTSHRRGVGLPDVEPLHPRAARRGGHERRHHDVAVPLARVQPREHAQGLRDAVLPRGLTGAWTCAGAPRPRTRHPVTASGHGIRT